MPLGCAGASPGGGRSERVVASPSSSVALDVAQRPAGQPLARVRARQADPHVADHAGVAVDLEPERRPGRRRVGNRQLVDRRGHAVVDPLEQLVERAAADHRLRLFGDHVRARARLVVPALDQQPLRLLAGAGALQGEAAAQLLAVEDEDGVAALERLRPGDPAALLVGAAVPDDHAALAERALEVVVGDRRGPRPGRRGA